MKQIQTVKTQGIPRPPDPGPQLELELPGVLVSSQEQPGALRSTQELPAAPRSAQELAEALRCFRGGS